MSKLGWLFLGRCLLDVPRVRLSTYGGRAFCYAGPSAWNALPDLKNNSTLLCLFLDVSWNIFPSHISSTPSAFEVFTVNALYKLLTSLLTFYLCAVVRSPSVSKDGAEPGAMSPTELSSVISATSKRVESHASSTRLPASEQRPDVGHGCGRKHARKSRLCVKNDASPESSFAGRVSHRHYHRPPTPDSSPIHLLPFSPSQVAHIFVSVLSVY